ncbi:hypothetical protein VNI00_017513 [Paramarasmius palmivorus]|uniref:Uncharacterized protein n=1 Tax=Paramarasmius palmivorus TaxID=297713 RepID=A0AAW0B6K4_9AGAR
MTNYSALRQKSRKKFLSPHHPLVDTVARKKRRLRYLRTIRIRSPPAPQPMPPSPPSQYYLGCFHTPSVVAPTVYFNRGSPRRKKIFVPLFSPTPTEAAGLMDSDIEL